MGRTILIVWREILNSWIHSFMFKQFNLCWNALLQTTAVLRCLLIFNNKYTYLNNYPTIWKTFFLLQMLHIEIWNHLNMWIYYVSRIGCGYTKMPMFDLDPRRCFPKLLSNKLIAARGWDVCHSAKISDILFWNFPRTTTQRPLSSIQWLCWDNVCCSSMWL